MSIKDKTIYKTILILLSVNLVVTSVLLGIFIVKNQRFDKEIF